MVFKLEHEALFTPLTYQECICSKSFNYSYWISSESPGQEDAGRMRQMSELFTGSTAMKFVNTLNKPP